MIEQILVTGTESVCPATMDKIEHHDLSVATFAGPFGSFVRVLSDPEVERKLVSVSDLLIVTALAREMGCTWVYLDPDSEPRDDLPTYSQN